MRLCYTEFMHKGGQNKTQAGFTIVETLIVLAVTSLILGAALILIGGRQARTQFNVGIGQVQQQVQQTISEVRNGYYPNGGNINCTATGVGAPLLTKIGPNQQGSNSGCILLGKAIQFAPDSNSSQMKLIPIAANRLYAGSEVTTIAEANPIAIAPSSSTDTATPDATENRTFDNGITVVGMWQNGDTNQKIGAVGILFSLADYNAYSGLLESGSLQASLYAINNTEIGQSVWQIAQAIKGPSSDPGSYMQLVKTVNICFASGTTNQSGLLTIGGSSGESLSVTMEIMSGKTCGESL